MTTDNIRREFLSFFAEKGHTIVPSSSLIPAGDPTLLFVNAGMVQFKDCFLGTDKRDYRRATTSQKCLRISGKHNDLENVGRTARHHTFFEMLGNFSFGDYFKQDAICFAWEFLTQRLALQKDRLWVTVYLEDDEAEDLWKQNTDVLDGRILRFGKEDNFWAMGETGPCGPCSEIHYYIGDNPSGQCEEEFRKNDGSYIEIWNLVFMQFNRDPNGELKPLPKPSVDTGMGLERVAAIKQGVLSNFDSDILRRLITLTEKMSGLSYNGSDYTERNPEEDKQYGIDVAMRVIADHVRAASFLIADGVLPSSEGRGYVLRRLIRRALRHGRVLGFKDPFLATVAVELCSIMNTAYPELKASKDLIQKTIHAEEGRFVTTLDTGIKVLEREAKDAQQIGKRELSGTAAFLLHDTYGFPLDLTEDMLRPKGMIVDREGFQKEMSIQRERSRAARASATELVLQRSVKPSSVEFVGYDYLEYESRVVGIFAEKGEQDFANAGDEVAMVTKETPFYGEAGGQVGDTGSISSNQAALEVIDTQRVGGDTIAHICRVVDGKISLGETVRLVVDAERRKNLVLNHSATHLLHLALRKVLGPHLKQAGSRVGDLSLRFDFTHDRALTSEQLREIEALINEQVRANHEIVTEILKLEEAKKSGAIALFGEKYGDFVRVVQIGTQSRELCGGTHASRSGDLGLVSIEDETSVAAGVRRIEAITGVTSIDRFWSTKSLITSLSKTIGSAGDSLPERVERIVERNRQLERELDRRRQVEATRQSGDLADQAQVRSDGTKILASVIEQVSPKELREMADDLRSRLKSACIALASVKDGKAILLTAVTKDLLTRYDAGDLMREISSITGASGGGKRDLAQAGGGDPSKLQQAMERFRELVS